MAENKSYITVNDENFEQEVIQSEQPVVVDFWAGWCAPCLMLGPTVEEIADEFKGRAKVAKLNVDEAPRSAQRYGVRSIPTLLFFRNGEVVDSSIGVVPKPVLAEKLTSLAAAAQNA